MKATLGLTVALAALLAAAPLYAGAEPDAACKNSKAKAAGKKAFGLLKAIGKNIKSPNQAKLDAAVSKAQSKFTKSFTKAEDKGGCATTGDADAIEAKIDAFAQEITATIPEVCGDGVRVDGEECDGADAAACPGVCQANCLCPPPVCGNGVIQTGEDCDPPCQQGPCGAGNICGASCTCEPIAPCSCGTPDPPTMLEFETELQAGTCGTLENTSGSTLLNLECSNSYLGGGSLGAAPVATPTPIGTSFYNVECCNGTSLALTPTSETDTGSERTCTTEGCFFGAPIPVITTNPGLSVCVSDFVNRDAFGSADCSSGEVFLDLPLRSPVFLTVDLVPMICDSDSGANTGCGCTDDSDCAGGTCIDSTGNPLDTSTYQPCPICCPGTLTCNGGPNDGMPCTPGTPDLGPQYPTSHDCPPTNFQVSETISPYGFKTETVMLEASDSEFCKFCRDVLIEGSDCFDGDPDDNPLPLGSGGCPNSALISTCQPALRCIGGADAGTSCNVGGDCDSGTCGQGDVSGCGIPVPCTDDSECKAPYETCAQKDPGANNQATATKITQNGAAAGDLTDRAQHAATLVSTYCVGPTFSDQTDQSTSLPGPGSISLPGNARLLPP